MHAAATAFTSDTSAFTTFKFALQLVIFSELSPRSEYFITKLGDSLLPILDEMIEWGEKNRKLFDNKYGTKGK
ncbi:MAG: hypothetical protein DBY24_03550 [Prevotellaceae bacterium]|nr:MAG: hypothetical protein DBY24_03550 [Prevotellaceae bacterium]